MKIRNFTQNSVLADKFQIAETFFSRMRGLLGRRSLEPGEALVITRCNSIHMFFMRFSIDVIFVDRNDVVVGLLHNIKPFCLSRIYFKASYAIELPAGTIDASRTALGEKIEIDLM